MSAQKVIESVAGEPPFANAVRVIEGARYDSGLFVISNLDDVKSAHTWAKNGNWHFRYAYNTPARGPIWHIPEVPPTVKAKTVRVGQTVDPGVLVLNTHHEAAAELLYLSETNNATWVILYPGDLQEVREKSTIVMKKIVGSGVREWEVKLLWRPRCA